MDTKSYPKPRIIGALTVSEVFHDLMRISALGEPTKRPSVRGTFNEKQVVMLYDTGSAVTCMSKETFKTLTKNDIIAMEDAGSAVFASASGDRIKARQKPIVSFEILGKRIEYPVFVIDKLHEPFILGIDFIKDENLSFCPSHCEFYWEGGCPKEQIASLGTRENVYIPALARRCCRVRVANQELAGKTVVASVALSGQPWIRGGPVLTEINENGDVWVEVWNASPSPREIPKNTTIGQLEECHVVCPIEDIGGKEEEKIWRNSTQEDKLFIQANAKIECEEALKKKYQQMFEEFPDIFSRHKNDLGRCDLLQHEIHLKDKTPVYIKQFKIPEGHATAVEDQVKEWLKLGIVQPSLSRYNSPIFIVKKKDGAFRLVQDFRALNAQTYADRYSMRDVTDCIHEIGKANSTLFSTIDLTSGFWQMVLKPECREYTAFTVYGMGQFEFKTSPMGLLGCPASFQRLMEEVMKGIPNVLVYIDDILVHSKTHDQHIEILRKVFARLQQHHLKIRLEKCHFANTTVEYLGFKLTPHGVLPGTDKIEVVKNAPPPDTVHKVRQFLGLCNFFRTHIKDFAIRSHPLTVLTRKDCDWRGGELPKGAMESFLELKTALTSSPLVAFPRSDRQYALITDAACGDDTNPGGMGAILSQIDREGRFYVISYASRKLLKHEKNYTPFLLEMHAAVWGMDHYSHHLKGKRFLLFTDHKPLEKLGKVHTKTLHRIQEAMMDFDFEIHYKKGAEMPADYLSRNISAINEFLPDTDIAAAQKTDHQLNALRDYLKHGTIPPDKQLRKTITRYASKCFIENDLLWIRLFQPEIGTRALICVPGSLRDQLVLQFHNSWYGGHEGVHKTIQRLQLYYFWPNMQTDVNNIIKACDVCQKRRTCPTLPPSNLQPLPLLSQPNQRVHADLFGPLRTSANGKKFILVMTDAFTKYAEIIAIHNKEAETVAEAVFYHWICRYGIPAQLVTDQGKEFVATVCKSLWKRLDLLHITTSARHPQANSQAEVINKTIARYLASFVNDTTLDWEQFIAPLMFSYNTAFHRSIKTSPFFLTYGVHPSLPRHVTTPMYGSDLPTDLMARLQIARNIAREHMAKASDEYQRQFNLHAKQKHFQVGQSVLLDEHSFLGKNTKLAPKFSGPHLVTRLIGGTNVELLLDNGKSTVIHVNRIKPFNTIEERQIPLDSHNPTPTNIFQNRGGVMADNNTERIDSDEEDENNETQDVDNNTSRSQNIDMETHDMVQEQGGSTKHFTRSVTKAKGMVYNKEQKQFLVSISQDSKEITAPKTKSRKRQQVQVKRIPYIELDDTWETVYETDYENDQNSEIEESEGEDEVFYGDTPFPKPLADKRRVIFADTPHSKIIEKPTPPQYYFPNTRYDPIESADKKNIFKATIDGTARVLFGGRDESFTDPEERPQVVPTGRKEARSESGHMDPPSVPEQSGVGRLRPILRSRSQDDDTSGYTSAEAQKIWPGGWKSGRDSLGRPTSQRRRNIAMGKTGGQSDGDDHGGQRDTHGGSSYTYEDATTGTQPSWGTKAGTRARSHSASTSSSHQRTGSASNQKTSEQTQDTVPCKDPTVTQYSRMATRGRPDYLDNPWQLSDWFAKKAGYNDPAVLRVLVSRYLTDVAEINMRVPTQPPDPEIFRDLDRRRAFLAKELRRTGVRVKGFDV